MSTISQFLCTQFVASGDEVFTIDQNTQANQIQVVCVSGSIQIEGKQSTNLLGKPVSPITLLQGQSFYFNERAYQNAKITVTNGSEAQFIANN